MASARGVLASSGADGTVRLWGTATGKQLLALTLDASVWAVALSPDGKLLAAGDIKGAVRLWPVAKLLAGEGMR